MNKQIMGTGYAGLGKELLYMNLTMMVFSNAKKATEDMVKAFLEIVAIDTFFISAYDYHFSKQDSYIS